jgi:large subunit ribosomal protein L31
MRQGIHPEYVECQVTCSCGNTFTTKATVPEMHLELCSECHPFYTGQQKFVDTGGRVGRFERKFGGDAATSVIEREEAEREKRRKEAEEREEVARKEREEREAARQKRRVQAEKKAARDAQFEETASDDSASAEEAPAEAQAPEAPEGEAQPEAVEQASEQGEIDAHAAAETGKAAEKADAEDESEEQTQ